MSVYSALRQEDTIYEASSLPVWRWILKDEPVAEMGTQICVGLIDESTGRTSASQAGVRARSGLDPEIRD